MGATENTDMEQRILSAAKQVFIEKGFSETSMNDIAVRVGINRSGLHYYFRTKERMFEAVYGDIVLSFIPSIHDIILQDKPLKECLSDMIDIYFDLFTREPGFPLFVIREIQRNSDYMFKMIRELGIVQYAEDVAAKLHKDMEKGVIRPVPLEFLVYTFFGLTAVPFLSMPLSQKVLQNCGRCFTDELEAWKPYVVSQMEHLLTGRPESDGAPEGDDKRD